MKAGGKPGSVYRGGLLLTSWPAFRRGKVCCVGLPRRTSLLWITLNIKRLFYLGNCIFCSIYKCIDDDNNRLWGYLNEKKKKKKEKKMDT